MSIQQALVSRSGDTCELCSSKDQLAVYDVPYSDVKDAQSCVLLCETCIKQIEVTVPIDMNHWRCLNDSMWNPEPAVQVMAWRMLKRLSTESWAQDLLDILYLDEQTQQWAEKDTIASGETSDTPTLDSNGAALQMGDTVTLIKDLDVKGANFTAKRGTAVRNIALTDNPEHIEGKVNGTRIVLVAKFLKKS
jgi:protein PhnA